METVCNCVIVAVGQSCEGKHVVIARPHWELPISELNGRIADVAVEVSNRCGSADFEIIVREIAE